MIELRLPLIPSPNREGDWNRNYLTNECFVHLNKVEMSF